MRTPRALASCSLSIRAGSGLIGAPSRNALSYCSGDPPGPVIQPRVRAAGEVRT